MIILNGVTAGYENCLVPFTNCDWFNGQHLTNFLFQMN